jgi:hypothetical protein
MNKWQSYFILLQKHILNRINSLFGFSLLMTEDEVNFVRLFKLISGIAPEAVREIFDRYFPPGNLVAILKKEEHTIKNLQCKKRLTVKQMSLLYPSIG